MSFSAWVENVSVAFPAFLTLWFWATLVVAVVTMTWKVFVFLPWWIFVITTLYVTLSALKNRFAGLFGAIAKVYAPIVILAYWLAIYPKHHPWSHPTDTYLVFMAYIVSPVIMLIETFRAKNTHLACFKQRNADFPVIYSFGANTAIYFIYLTVYLLALHELQDPIYTGIGFTMDKTRDTLLAFVGWIVVLTANTVVALWTWVWRNREMAIISRNFEETSGITSSYVMDMPPLRAPRVGK